MINLNPLSPKKTFTFLFTFVVIIFFISIVPVVAQERIVISGVAKSTVGTLFGTDESWNFAAEQYANFRIQAPVSESGVIHAAFNVLASATPEEGVVTEGEIERLYALFRFDTSDWSAGLMRIPFGYGMGIRPTDIINPQNPLFPDARLQGVLASLVAWYPKDELRIQAFAVQRTDEYFEGQSISFRGESLFGCSLDRHTPVFSAQGLALTTVPGKEPAAFLLHFGFSIKFDLIAGFALDALVTTDGKTQFAEGRENAAIAAAIGCDYSCFDGKLFILAQYLYTSAGLLSADDSLTVFLNSGAITEEGAPSLQSLQSNGSTYIRRHYGFFTVLYNHSDYARLQLSVLASPVDSSCFSTLRHEFEPAQAVTLITLLAVPLDQTTFGKSTRGSLGPDLSRMYMAASFSVEYRF